MYINDRYKLKYQTNKVVFISNKKPVILICPDHGEFEITRNAMLLSKLSVACPICKKKERGEVYDTASCITKIENKFGHGHFDLSKVIYNGYRSEIEVGCLNGHGFFNILPDRLYAYNDCPKCSKLAKAKRSQLTLTQFIDKAKSKHGNIYNYSSILEYNGLLKPVTITCSKHGTFKQLAGNHLNGKGCPSCGIITTKAEIEILDWLKSLNQITIHQYRDKYELDIFLPEYNLGIEYNGLWWHSELYKPKNYHAKKSNYFMKKGIRVIHLWEDEWTKNPQQIKAYLTHQLGLTESRIFARNTTTELINSKDANLLLEKAHLLGRTNAKYYIGLKYNDKLVAIGAFSNNASARGINQWEMVRYVTDGAVVGGLSKIMSSFRKLTKIYTPITSYTDNDKFSGSSYAKAGFIQLNEVSPDYKTISQSEYWRHPKQFTKRSNLAKILGSVFDKNKTEHQNCLNNNIYRVYDSGKIKWIYY